jgi:hypothetical protein
MAASAGDPSVAVAAFMTSCISALQQALQSLYDESRQEEKAKKQRLFPGTKFLTHTVPASPVRTPGKLSTA